MTQSLYGEGETETLLGKGVRFISGDSSQRDRKECLTTQNKNFHANYNIAYLQNIKKMLDKTGYYSNIKEDITTICKTCKLSTRSIHTNSHFGGISET
jgi:hypothetical protein